MITFFSDPHIGMNRQAGTSPASRKVWSARSFASIRAITGNHLVCLGDLVDKYTNTEDVIINASSVFNRLSLCVAGNHDLRATKDSVGTLQLLDNLQDLPDGMLPTAVIAPFGQVCSDKRTIDGVDIVTVPHCSTQELFFQSLIEAEKLGGEILLLHCNYDSPDCREISKTELNLRKEDAEELLKVFKFILIGHEHNASEHFDGRLKIIGSVYPTSFGDMKRKQYLTYQDGEFTNHVTWSASGCVEIDWDEVPDGFEAEFVRLTGSRNHSQGKEFLGLVNMLRKSVLAIKDDTVLEGTEQLLSTACGSSGLVDCIESSLANKPEELELWKEMKS